MAQKILIQLVDDLTGASAPDVSTVTFGLDGAAYEIDLTEANARRLRDLLAQYVDAARRVGGRLKRATKPSPARDQSPAGDTGQIRLWAQKNGHTVARRGRIPATIVEAYQQAQTTKATTKGTPRVKRRGGAKTG